MSRIAFSVAVPHDHASLPGHFPGTPIVPGVLLLDVAMQALESATGRPVVRLQQVKFASALLPGELAQGHWDVAGSRASLRLEVTRDGIAVKVADGAATLSGEEPA